jgi:hypothetical protein
LSTLHMREFLRSHLPRCRCPRPAPKTREDCRAALGRFVEFLRSQKLIRESAETVLPLRPVDRLTIAYDRHMDRVCGLSSVVRQRRRLGARQFVAWRFGRGRPRWRQLHAKDVSKFVFLKARRLGPTGIRALVVTALPQLLSDAARRFAVDERESP